MARARASPSGWHRVKMVTGARRIRDPECECECECESKGEGEGEGECECEGEGARRRSECGVGGLPVLG